jgi:formamidopyrimidine-DNA glycosylase
VIFILGNGKHLIFEDARKFGRIWLLSDPQQELGDLGPEPLSEELTVEQFHQMLQGSKRQLKPLLMDQTFLAGLGNIYTDESLFKAKLHPLSIASELSFDQTAVLLKAIRETLLEGIQRNGASIDWAYRGGDFQNHFSVYGKKGKPCPICGTPVKRIVIGQRGTHFCPSCQKRIPLE